MGKAKREQLLIGLLVCLVSVVGLGMLLAFPSYDSWQKQQAQVKQLEGDLAQLASARQRVDIDIVRFSQTPHLPKDIVIRTSDDQHVQKNVKAMLDELVSVATGMGNELISLLPSTADPAVVAVAAPATAQKPLGNSKDAPQQMTIKSSTANGPKTEAPSALTTPPVASSATPSPDPATNASSVNGAAVAAEPDVTSLLKHFEYELSFRGNYDEALGFLAHLNHHHELVEVTNVELKNEGGAQRQEYKSDTHFDMSKPILMKLNLQLILQPKISI